MHPRQQSASGTPARKQHHARQAKISIMHKPRCMGCQHQALASDSLVAGHKGTVTNQFDLFAELQ